MQPFIGRYISILYRQEQKYMSGLLSEYDFGFSSFNFLLYIARNEGVSQKQLCTILALDESLATRELRRLEEKKLILRDRDPLDQRSYCVYLTEEGRKLVPIFRREVRGWWKQLMAGMDDEEKELLSRQLEKMADHAVMLNQKGRDTDC
ncbi:MarR family winged helix-turn-helix transcriptional regulator [Murimonas intestini]|uniref:MarR family transcriptional regulator n=1 Tax=Murimonas intestini TaxID=1337051 RepID=A0AB73T259_9FIRM|nr:MarR family transcriptional regulator [Murimonas intestini]MCR1842535.1 MarR family transcriptional regulator [Murimonas intestini]MCR1867107.1 MarR family transcriptional regulator [Murimonas intestini]MCR1884293.1 MarR family transcriptional regulator [Murimonas intestini]